jgi:prepilin-type N-terminal cleavage/methylation domain-containing protein/prepilin-type processing-associated H-X9-DG protein
MTHRHRTRTAFSLIELLIVIAIIGVIIALLLPAVQMVREAAHRTQCGNNLHQIGEAFMAYNMQYNRFPDGGAGWWLARCKNPQGVPLRAPNQNWGWAYQILPFMEQQNLWANPDDSAVAAAVIPIYFCPSRRDPVALPGILNGIPDGSLRGAIDYAGNGGTGPGVFTEGYPIWPDGNGTVNSRFNDAITPTNIRDGASNTLLAGERNVNLKYMGWGSLLMADENDGYIDGYDWDVIRWAYDVPAPDRRDDSWYDWRFGSSHIGGVQFLFADGSVRWVQFSVDLTTFQRLSCRNDGLPTPNDY